MKKLWQVAVLVLLLNPSRLMAQTSSDEWEFMLTPFLWGVGFDATLGIAGRETDVEVSAKDLLKSLDFAFMANFEARKNRWSFATDIVFADLGKEGEARLPSELPGVAPPKLDVSLAIIEGTLGYQVAESVDFLVGVRGVAAYTAIEVLDEELFEGDAGWVDPIVGARFRRYLSEKFWINFRGDVGGFGVGSDFSWLVSVAGAYRANHLLSIDFGYRIWGFDYKSDNDVRKLDANFSGFGAGLTFHF